MTEVEPTRVEVSPDQTQARVYFRDLSYTDFGRSETLHHFRLPRIMEPDLAFNKCFLDFPNLTNKDHGMYVVGQRFRFEPALWSVRRGTWFPYEVHTELTEIGKSSATIQSRLVNKLDQKELARLMMKLVYVHRATGRSAPFPDWMQRKYKPAVQKEREPFTLPRSAPQVPTTAYRYDATVAQSDLDHNNHTNQGSYSRFCSDATHAAVKEGSLPRLEPDVCNFPLMELQTIFTGQSRMGDKLQVLLWQQEDCRDTIHYVIRKKDEDRVIFHGHMLFGQSSALVSHL